MPLNFNHISRRIQHKASKCSLGVLACGWGLISIYCFVFIVGAKAAWANSDANKSSASPIHDPTKPFNAPELISPVTNNNTKPRTAPMVYQLQAIIVRNGERKALINGEWMQESQKNNGITLNKVNNNSVIVQIAGKSLHLQLNPSIIQRQAINRQAHEAGQP